MYAPGHIFYQTSAHTLPFLSPSAQLLTNLLPFQDALVCKVPFCTLIPSLFPFISSLFSSPSILFIVIATSYCRNPKPRRIKYNTHAPPLRRPLSQNNRNTDASSTRPFYRSATQPVTGLYKNTTHSHDRHRSNTALPHSNPRFSPATEHSKTQIENTTSLIRCDAKTPFYQSSRICAVLLLRKDFYTALPR